jgi:hypothetical protein
VFNALFTDRIEIPRRCGKGLLTARILAHVAKTRSGVKVIAPKLTQARAIVQMAIEWYDLVGEWKGPAQFVTQDGVIVFLNGHLGENVEFCLVDEADFVDWTTSSVPPRAKTVRFQTRLSMNEADTQRQEVNQIAQQMAQAQVNWEDAIPDVD